MRPRCCEQGHELVWLTDDLAVCNECDTEHFIYRRQGLVSRLVESCSTKLQPQRAPTNDRKGLPLHAFSVTGLATLFR